jgi:SAM-dependent methyltransferase
MESTANVQNAKSVAKNIEFFADNDQYKTLQNDLELYQFMALSATHETASARRLLDIGNGGVFIYPIEHIPEVEAIDIFVEEDFASRYPTVKWSQVSALEMNFERGFDTVVAVNTLHHVVGDSVKTTYDNLQEIMTRSYEVLEPGGKLLLIESTVPAWFLWFYKIAFGILVKCWPLKHPPTFQFHFREILSAASKAGFVLKEFCFVPKTSDVMTLGFRVKRWMTPIQVGKFVLVRPANSSEVRR